jgi:hypothetical protein
MFGPAGHAYIYRSYGIHWCLNFVCGKDRSGSAVLIRALQPIVGVKVMRRRRGDVPDRKLCGGPGNLTQALAITGELDGKSLYATPFELIAGETEGHLTASSTRIGITRGTELPWRLGLVGSALPQPKVVTKENMARTPGPCSPRFVFSCLLADAPARWRVDLVEMGNDFSRAALAGNPPEVVLRIRFLQTFVGDEGAKPVCGNTSRNGAIVTSSQLRSAHQAVSELDVISAMIPEAPVHPVAFHRQTSGSPAQVGSRRIG